MAGETIGMTRIMCRIVQRIGMGKPNTVNQKSAEKQ